jgi:hypothetical protein
MFQAAAGLALSRRLALPLFFDLSRFRNQADKAYALAGFDLDASLLPHDPVTPVNRAKKLVARMLGHRSPRLPTGWDGLVYKEPHFHYDPAFATLNGPVFLTGYFQSPRYFAGYEDGIRQAFDASTAVSQNAQSLANDIRKQTSLAVHVRRGDMASDPKMAAVHGTLGHDYYDAAIAHVRDEVPSVRLFFFSDDSEAAMSFAQRYQGEVLHGQSALDDLWLMAQCNHHVIANSSFSWWSAHLDPRPEGIRIAPKQWFTPEELSSVHIGDLFPTNWVRI